MNLIDLLADVYKASNEPPRHPADICPTFKWYEILKKQKWERAKRERHRRELKLSFAHVVDQYVAMKPTDKEKLGDLFREEFTPIVDQAKPIIDFLRDQPTLCVFTHSAAIVTYSIDATNRLPSLTVDAKLKEILDANPAADLKRYEKPLGITMKQIERKPPKNSDGGIYA